MIFRIYTILIFVWVIYIINTLYQNRKMRQFFPNKKIEILTIPFYIYYFTGLYILFFSNPEAAFSFNSAGQLLQFFLRFAGLLFCLSSVALFTYANFFEKSFPSCITLKKNEELGGIYKYIRHPSYYVFFLLLFGTALSLLNATLFIIACINHVSLYIFYALEENKIKKQNPYYVEYLKKTHRFFPKF